MLSDRTGLLLAVGVSAANTHDSLGLQPLVRAIPAVRSRRGLRHRRPDKLHADKGYDYPHLRAWLRDRRITPCIARRGVDTSARLGRHRWQVESTIAWLFGYPVSPSATNATPSCSAPFSPSELPSPATTDSPHETRPY